MIRARYLVLAAAAAGCGTGSLLDEARVSRAAAPLAEISSSGAQSPEIVGLYVDQMVKRMRARCSPPPGTTAEIVVTVDRDGYIAELGMRASTDTLVDCARSEIESQRLPKARGPTLIAARLEL